MSEMKAGAGKILRGGKALICCLLAICLILLPLLFPKALWAAEIGEDSFNSSLIYRELKFEHNLASVAVYDSKWEQFLYGDNLLGELDLPGISRLFLIMLAAERLESDQLILISSRAAVADRQLATNAPAEINLAGGQKFPLAYLIYRMLFYDSDGAAVAIAEALAGDESSCLALLNERAEEIGLENTELKSLRLAQNSSGQSPGSKNTTTAADLVKLMLNMQRLPLVMEWLETYEAFLTVDVDGQRLVSMRSPISRLWTLSEGQVNLAFNVQADSSVTITTGTTKEGYSIISVVVSAGKSIMIQDTIRLYSAIDNYYETTPLVTKGEKMEGLRERAQNGEVFELVYLETIEFLHPEEDLFLTQEIQYVGNPPYLLPLTAGTITGQVLYTLKNGMKITVNVGPDRSILASRLQIDFFLQNLNNNPNLARVLFILVLALIFLMAIYLIRNILRIYFYLRYLRRSRHGM